jgi:hypothetical protein
MLDYKYSNIASGDILPSGALSAHPIEDEITNSEDEESLSYKNFDYIVDKMQRDYSHREGIGRSNLSSEFFDFISQNLAAI